MRKEDPLANPKDAESDVQEQIEEATQYARSNLEPNDSVDEVLYILAPKITNTAARYSILSDFEFTNFHLGSRNSVPKHGTPKHHGCPSRTSKQHGPVTLCGSPLCEALTESAHVFLENNETIQVILLPVVIPICK